MDQLFIPKTIKVGYQKRSDTYTGKLAYVIYIDNKGVVRKEKSWNTWCSKDIEKEQFDNVPISGFVLNKKVGGYKSDWNFRQAYVRIYDPRNFEFEISVENLLFILAECDCSRGKGLEGELIYSWSGQDLVLLPVSCESYKKCTEFTRLQDHTVKAKELIKGSTYTTKTQETLIYLGKFDLHNFHSWKVGMLKAGPKYVFFNTNPNPVYGNVFTFLKDLKTIAVLKDSTVVDNYSDLVDKFYKSTYGSKIVELFLEPVGQAGEGDWFSKADEQYIQCNSYKDKDNVIYSIRKNYNIGLQDNRLVCNYVSRHCLNPKFNKKDYSSYYYSDLDWVEPTNLRLRARLESGAIYNVNGSSLQELQEIKDE